MNVPFNTCLSARHVLEATASNESIVTAVTGRCIRIVQLVVCAAGTGANALTLKSGTSNAILPALYVTSGGPLVLPFSPIGWADTEAGAALTATHDGGTENVTMVVSYITVPSEDSVYTASSTFT